jgi:hypothetical protein
MILAAVAAEVPAGTFNTLMDHVAQGFEALGAAILVAGVIWSFVLALVAVRRSGWSAKAYLVSCARPSAGPCCSGWKSWSPPTWFAPLRSRLPPPRRGRIIVGRAGAGVGENAAVEDAGGEDRDAPLLARGQEPGCCGRVEERVPARHQHTVQVGPLDGPLQRPGLVHAYADRPDHLLRTELVDAATSRRPTLVDSTNSARGRPARKAPIRCSDRPTP